LRERDRRIARRRFDVPTRQHKNKNLNHRSTAFRRRIEEILGDLHRLLDEGLKLAIEAARSCRGHVETSKMNAMG
jgi:hypothetical protein